MDNKDYWLQRKIRNNKRSIKEENKLLKEIYELLANAYNETINNIYAFYGEYANEEGISITQAQKLLTPTELKECANRIKRIQNKIDKIDTSTPFGREQERQLKKELRLLRGRGRITREMLLNDSINEHWIEVAYEMDKKLGEHLAMNYERSFKEALEETKIKRVIGISRKQIEASILLPTFAYHFSDTIWKNKDKLIAFINTELRRGIVQGTDVRKTAKKLKEHMEVTKYEAKRLVVTETASIQINGTLEGYKESNVVKKVEVLVYIDKRTCNKCKDHEGAIVELDEAVVGDNIPPFHPSCRCDIVPYIE